MNPSLKNAGTIKRTPASFGPSDPTDTRIIEILQEGELTLFQIAEKLQLPEEEIEHHLNVLGKQKLVCIRQNKGIRSQGEQIYRASAINVITGKSAAKLLLHPIASQILNLLTEKEMSLSEISKKLDIPKSKVNYHITRLMEDGLILKTRIERFKGLLKPFYRAKWKVNLPRLQSLRQEKTDRPDRVAGTSYLELLKFFLWGWLMGKGYSVEKVSKTLAMQGSTEEVLYLPIHSELVIEVADVLEQLASREQDFPTNGSPPADELRFDLLHKAASEVLREMFTEDA